MAGHSHWAGIKHKKGKADKQRSKIFSKLSKEITVAAKLGDKDATMNPRLRSAIQAARSANMPKDNIERAIDKSSAATGVNFENLRYEGFGPDKIAVIVETLTDNKNRTASNIRTIFQKNGGSLGTQGSASHNFKQLGIIKIDKNEISEENIFELAIDSGADECISKEEFHEANVEYSLEPYAGLAISDDSLLEITPSKELSYGMLQELVMEVDCENRQDIMLF